MKNWKEIFMKLENFEACTHRNFREISKNLIKIMINFGKIKKFWLNF